MHDIWQQWSGEGTVLRRLDSRRPRGTIEREERCARGMVRIHHTASAEVELQLAPWHLTDKSTPEGGTMVSLGTIRHLSPAQKYLLHRTLP